MNAPDVHARSGDLAIAYSVCSEGPSDVVILGMIMGTRAEGRSRLWRLYSVVDG